MIRVASIPASHPYVQAVADATSLQVLPDPQPSGATEPGQWWPPRWLEPEYLLAHIGEIDVMHIHFGFDVTPLETLSAICTMLAAHGKPMIVTVHDLHNPHFVDSVEHHARLGILLSAAAAVITLTRGAAQVIASQWHRTPAVLAHPHLLPVADIGSVRARRDRPILAVHAKSLRANINPWPIIDALTAAGLDASLRLDLDDGALDSSRAPADLHARLAGYASRQADVRIHPPFSDIELHRYLSEIDILVLPYEFGTHSGWVELCHDAGVRLAVPLCGYFHEQHPAWTYRFDRTGFDGASLITAVRGAITDVNVDAGSENRDRRRAREVQRLQVQRAHIEIYRRAINEFAANRRSA